MARLCSAGPLMLTAFGRHQTGRQSARYCMGVWREWGFCVYLNRAPVTLLVSVCFLSNRRRLGRTWPRREMW